MSETSNIELLKIAVQFKIPSFFVCRKDKLKSNIENNNYKLNLSDSDKSGSHSFSLIIDDSKYGIY
jgi:hypothetical protein